MYWGAQGVVCTRPSFLPGYFYLLAETENYVQTNNIGTGIILRRETYDLSFQMEKN
jgi:hypothetical protein